MSRAGRSTPDRPAFCLYLNVRALYELRPEGSVNLTTNISMSAPGALPVGLASFRLHALRRRFTLCGTARLRADGHPPAEIE